ncbi:hypothetical protein [Bradyrhizobium sp. SRL28]|nr:hypothetical protein [Bradyrhizobium sp. SRL28]
MAIAKFNLLIAEVRAALERLIDVLADLGLPIATATRSGLAST